MAQVGWLPAVLALRNCRSAAICGWSIAATYQKYTTTGPILPAMGYGEEQMRDLEATINNSDVDLVISATPIDLNRVIKVRKPMQRVRYELQEIGQPTLEDVLKAKFVK